METGVTPSWAIGLDWTGAAEHREAVVGSFKLISPYARGASSEVWRARHTVTGHEAAVRFLLKSGQSLEESHAQARRIARLRHPGIAATYDFSIADHRVELCTAGRIESGTPFIAMELIRGGDLLQNRAAFAQHADAIVCQLLDALAYAHSRNVLHGDISPANILLREKRGHRPVLVDFTKDASTGPAAAPEVQQLRYRDYGPWSDLYALAWVTRELSVEHTSSETLKTFWSLALEHAPGRRPHSAAHALRLWGREPTHVEPRREIMPGGLGRWLVADPPFVGREDVVRAVLDWIRFGTERLGLLEGPPKSGRSRTLRWLCAHAQLYTDALVFGPISSADTLCDAVAQEFRTEHLAGGMLRRQLVRSANHRGVHLDLPLSRLLAAGLEARDDQLVLRTLAQLGHPVMVAFDGEPPPLDTEGGQLRVLGIGSPGSWTLGPLDASEVTALRNSLGTNDLARIESALLPGDVVTELDADRVMAHVELDGHAHLSVMALARHDQVVSHSELTRLLGERESVAIVEELSRRGWLEQHGVHASLWTGPPPSESTLAGYPELLRSCHQVRDKTVAGRVRAALDGPFESANRDDVLLAAAESAARALRFDLVERVAAQVHADLPASKVRLQLLEAHRLRHIGSPLAVEFAQAAHRLARQHGLSLAAEAAHLRMRIAWRQGDLEETVRLGVVARTHANDFSPQLCVDITLDLAQAVVELGGVKHHRHGARLLDELQPLTPTQHALRHLLQSRLSPTSPSARQLALSALEGFRDAGRRSGCAAAYVALGDACWEVRDFDQAEASYRSALQSYTELGSSHLVRAELRLGALLLSVRRGLEAWHCIDGALRMLRVAEPTLEARWSPLLAPYDIADGDPERALRRLNAARARAPRPVVLALHAVADELDDACRAALAFLDRADSVR